MKKILFALVFTLSLNLNAQWKGTTSNDDQRTMMVDKKKKGKMLKKK